MKLPFTVSYDKRFWFGFFWNKWDDTKYNYAQCYLTIIPLFPIIWNVRLNKVYNDK